MSLAAGTWQVDPQFMAAPGASDRLIDVARAADGSLWVAGYFNEFHAVPQPLVARLLADGRLAPGFQSPFTAREGGGPMAHQVVPRPEGGAYVAGSFTEAGGLARPGLVRLREDGSVDPGFQPPAVQPARAFLSLHPDPRGGLWVWGNFTNLGGQPRPGLARLEADGTVDAAFRPVLPASHEVAGVVPGRPGEAVLWMESTTTNAPAFPLLEALSNGTTRPVLMVTPLPPGRLRGLWPAGGARPGFWLAGSSDADARPFGAVPIPDASQRWLVRLESSESGGWTRRGPELAFRHSAYGTAQARINDVQSAPDGSTWVSGLFDAVGSPDHFEPAPSVVRLDPPGWPGGQAVVELGARDQGFLGLIRQAVPTAGGGVVLGGLFRRFEDRPAGGLIRLVPRPSEPLTVEWAVSELRVNRGAGRIHLPLATRGTWTDSARVRWTLETGPGLSPTELTVIPASSPLTLEPPGIPQDLEVHFRPDPRPAAARAFTLRLTTDAPGVVVGARSALRVQLDAPVLEATGRPDPRFAPRLTLPVHALRAAPEGGWWVGLGQESWPESRGTLLRLLPDGAVDPAFAPIQLDGPVLALAEDAAGRLLAGGAFGRVNGATSGPIFRVTGARLDESFSPFADWPSEVASFLRVTHLFGTAEGGLLAGGGFQFPGQSESRPILRVNPAGRVDPGFAAGAFPGGTGTGVLAPLPDGQWLAGLQMGRLPVRRGNRLGELDPRYAPWSPVWCAVQQLATGPDGRWWMTGLRPTGLVPSVGEGMVFWGSSSGEIHSLSSAPFRSADGWVQLSALLPEADGRLVVGGRFDRFGDWRRNSLVRLQANGDLDPTFDVGAGPAPRQVVEQGVTHQVPPEIRVVAPHPQGGWLVGGDFASFDSLAQPFLVRLGPGAPAIARTVQWETPQARLEEGAGSTDLLLRRTGSGEASMTVLVAVPEPQRDPITGQFTGYVPQNRLVTFAPGEWWQRIWVDGFDDSRAAPDAVVSARLLEAWDGFALAGNPAVELTVRNDDFAVEFLERTLERDEGDREVRVGLVWRGSEPATVPAGRLREWRTEVVYQPPGRPEVVVQATLPFAGDPAPAEAGAWVPRPARTNWISLPIPDDAVRRMDETWTVRLRPPASAWPAYPAQPSAGTALTVRIRDNDFNLGARRGANGPVHALALDPDGRLYVGGAFTSLHGRPRAGLARLLPDGRIDESFSPTHFPDGPVVALTILPDGGILAAGEFQRAGGPDGYPRSGLAAFDQAGGLRPEFGAGIGPRRRQAPWFSFATPVEEPGSIAALTALTDGSILAAGNFGTFDGLSRPGLVRLQPDGTVDPSWIPALSAPLLPSDPFLPPRPPFGRSLDPAWTGVRTDELGRVWVWNRETLRSARLLADGRADPGLTYPGQVTTILPQTGGAFWVGRRTQAPIQPARTARSDWLSVSRYQPDGQPDPAFQVRDVPPRMVDVAEVLHLAHNADGRLWVVVDLGPWAVNAPRASVLLRLQADGRLDGSFPPVETTTGRIRALATTDSRAWLAGDFREAGGESRRHLAQVSGSGLAGTLRLGWLRGSDGSLYLLLPGNTEVPWRLEQAPDLKTWSPGEAVWPDAHRLLPVSLSPGSTGWYRLVEAP